MWARQEYPGNARCGAEAAGHGAQVNTARAYEGVTYGREAQTFLAGCQQRGVYLKWFGSREAKGYTSLSGQWRYVANAHTPPATLQALDRLCDMRIPLNLPIEACDEIVGIIAEELSAVSLIIPPSRAF